MTTAFKLLTINTPQIVTIPGGAVGSTTIYLQFTAAPSAGTVTIEARQIGTSAWSPLIKAVNVPITSGEFAVRVDGYIAALRVTFTGLVGGSEPTVYVASSDNPVGLFTGLAAITVQGYIEANVKNGGQFYIQLAVPQLPATTGVSKLLFTTGAKQVLVKGRELYGVGESISIQTFRQPTAPAPGGTLVTVQNFSDVNPGVTTVQVRIGVTTTADGTPWGDPQRLFGASSTGQRAGSGLAPGGDRILRANSTYLVVFKNNGSGLADMDYFLTWYEGGTDLPL